MAILNEIIDPAIDEELLLDYEDNGEFYLIAAAAAFMKRDLKRIVGFYELVVPSYSIDEFRSHFRMTKNTFEILARGYNPYRKSFWKETNSTTETGFGRTWNWWKEASGT